MDMAVSIMNGAASVFSGIWQAMTYFLFASPLVIAAFVVILMKKYKHRIILRQKTKGDTDRVIDTRFCILNKKGQAPQIKTMARRLLLPIPPDEAKDFQENGSIFCEGYLTEGGEVTWINIDAKSVETVTKDKIKLTNPKTGKDDEIELESKKEKIKDIKLIKLSTQDKAFYFNREKIANSKYAVGGFWDFLSRNAGIIGLILFIFILFLFWGDIMQPAIDAKEIDAGRVAMELKIVDKLDMLINDRQIIPDDPEFNVTAPPVQEAPG